EMQGGQARFQRTTSLAGHLQCLLCPRHQPVRFHVVGGRHSV
ncbi:hypothetical protein D049_1121B, partial [Vibrio parahaemolyticus VPTS-2010]